MVMKKVKNLKKDNKKDQKYKASKMNKDKWIN